MNLKNLIAVLRGGNIALGHKLNNLLTEDVSVIEYTDDSVLFRKAGKLVLAKFNHNLSESKLTSDNIIDNEVINISGKESKKLLENYLHSVIDNLIEENYVDSEKALNSFCETYYQYSVLKSRFPELFTENLVKKSKGFLTRKKAFNSISDFKAELFSALTLKENKSLELHDYTNLLESEGHVLALGKAKLKPVIADAVLGNLELAETITNQLYEVAKTLYEANEDLETLANDNYNLEDGKYESEDTEEVESEDLTADPENVEMDFITDDDAEPKELEDFDPSKLSEDEVKQLHKTILQSILTSMKDFIKSESNNPDNSEIAVNMDDTLEHDLEALSNEEISDQELSVIEARWQPLVSYFLDSDKYTPDQDLSDDTEIEDVASGGEDSDLAEQPESSEEEIPETATAPDEVNAEEVKEPNLGM